MPFDLIKGDTRGPSWSRGDWVSDHAFSAAKKRVTPAVPILVGAGIAAGGLLLLFSGRRKGGKIEGYVRSSPSRTDPTRAIPYESMRELVKNRRR
jgi:hypothetical protein